MQLGKVRDGLHWIQRGREFERVGVRDYPSSVLVGTLQAYPESKVLQQHWTVWLFQRNNSHAMVLAVLAS
jgi:hypothetical protein